MSKWALFFVACLVLAATSASSEWGEPVNLGPNVNWAFSDYYPSISFDGMTLYFSSRYRPDGFGQDDIWISTWDGAVWGVPVNAGPNVNTVGRELSNSISADGTKLYFVAYGRPGGQGAWDIWVSTWEDTIWGPPTNAGPNVNTSYDEFTVNISFDGNKLYLSSNRPGTRGDDDLWVSEWDSTSGEWGSATNLGPNVNTPSADYCPSISADGTKLYFASWLVGHPDIFVSEWQDTVWGPKANLGPPVNTDAWENGPSISKDGTKLYFASGRESSHPALQDIWVSERVPGVQEKEEARMRIRQGASLTCLPNPFSSTAVIRYSLPEPGHLSLRIYDVAGRLVRTQVDGFREPGTDEVAWDGANDRGDPLTSGVYFCRLQAGSSVATDKLHLVR